MIIGRQAAAAACGGLVCLATIVAVGGFTGWPGWWLSLLVVACAAGVVAGFVWRSGRRHAVVWTLLAAMTAGCVGAVAAAASWSAARDDVTSTRAQALAGAPHALCAEVTRAAPADCQVIATGVAEVAGASSRMISTLSLTRDEIHDTQTVAYLLVQSGGSWRVADLEVIS